MTSRRIDSEGKFNRLAELPALEFVSFHTQPTLHEELANILPMVRQICLQGYMWNVIQSPEGPSLSRWEEDKWIFRGVLDFPSSDAFWLSAYHEESLGEWDEADNGLL